MVLPPPSQGRWDPDSLRPALRLGGQATAWEGSPGVMFARVQRVSTGHLEHPGRRGRGGAVPSNLLLMHDTGCLGLVHWDDPEGW